MSKSEAFVRELVAQFRPQLEPLLAEHLDDNREILPHLFLADVMRYVVDQHSRPLGKEVTERLLEYLEHCFVAGEDEIENLIAVGFLENLPLKGERGYEVRELLGSALSAEAARVAGW